MNIVVYILFEFSISLSYYLWRLELFKTFAVFAWLSASRFVLPAFSLSVTLQQRNEWLQFEVISCCFCSLIEHICSQSKHNDKCMVKWKNGVQAVDLFMISSHLCKCLIMSRVLNFVVCNFWADELIPFWSIGCRGLNWESRVGSICQ